MVKVAVDVCLAAGQVLARGRMQMEHMVLEEIVVAEVDIMGATVEMVEGEGGEEEMAGEEEGEMAGAEGETAGAEEETAEETAEGVVRLLVALPRKVGDATDSDRNIRGVREKHD